MQTNVFASFQALPPQHEQLANVMNTASIPLPSEDDNMDVEMEEDMDL